MCEFENTKDLKKYLITCKFCSFIAKNKIPALYL